MNGFVRSNRRHLILKNPGYRNNKRQMPRQKGKGLTLEGTVHCIGRFLRKLEVKNR